MKKILFTVLFLGGLVSLRAEEVPDSLSVQKKVTNARFASGFEVGTRVRVWGRVQSREYTKKLSETECEKRVAYEVSISKLEEGEPENETA